MKRLLSTLRRALPWVGPVVPTLTFRVIHEANASYVGEWDWLTRRPKPKWWERKWWGLAR